MYSCTNQPITKEMLSDCLTSETRREGLKQISISIHNLLLNNKGMTYKEILSNIVSSNTNTLRRRVYDVLSVMRALNMVIKERKSYNLIKRNPICEKRIILEEKRKQFDDLNRLKDVFEHIVKRNAYRTYKLSYDKYFLPFMIVTIEKNSNVHCETNEERTFFKFKSNKPIKLIEDIEILKEIYKITGEKENKNQNVRSDSLEKFMEDFEGVFDHIS